MKKSMIIGKRQIVLAVLILVLGVAVYLNWRYASDGNMDLTAALTSQKNMGDAQYVNTQGDDQGGEDSETAETAAKSNYDFEKARADRQQSRTDALAILTEMINNAKTDETSKKQAGEDAAQLAKNVENENSIESLVKAKGFEECIAIISDSSANVVVKKDGELEQTEMLQIQDIVMAQTSIPLDNIHIASVN